ncbi:MAG: AAA family ATPase [Promethearchaeota archaeon]|jgi:dephospho-CoA kinase
MKILAIVGLPGSGKTTAIEAIKDLGTVVTMGDIIRDEAQRRNIKPSGPNLGQIAQQLRQDGGPGIIAKHCVELINKMKEDIIFVDGIRSLAEVSVFRKFWKFPIIAITVNEKKRLRRLLKRFRSDDPNNLVELKERDLRELKFGLDNVIREADYKIKNNSTVEELKKKTRIIVIKVIQNYENL